MMNMNRNKFIDYAMNIEFIYTHINYTNSVYKKNIIVKKPIDNNFSINN